MNGQNASTFADLDRPRRRKSGCFVCGKPTVAQVSLTVRLLGNAKRTGATGRQITSWTRSMCEPCAVRAFVAAEEALEAQDG